MKKRNISVYIFATIVAIANLLGATSCTPTEASRVSYNISQQADNFNVTRKLTAINARTDTVLMEIIGTFSLKNNYTNELEVICEVGEGVYKKHFVYLNDYTIYVVEDISGANVDKYHYEINILPQMIGGVTITSND